MTCQNRFGIRLGHHNRLQASAEICLATRSSQLAQISNLTKRGEDLAVCRAKRIGVNCTGGRQGSRHIPIAEYHEERCVAFPTRHRSKIREAFRVKLSQKPSPRFSQYRLSAELEQLEVQLCTFERRRRLFSLLISLYGVVISPQRRSRTSAGMGCLTPPMRDEAY
jgi:hypothetical protein